MGYPALCVMALSLLVTACAFPHRKVSPMPMPSYEEVVRVDDESTIEEVTSVVTVVDDSRPAKVKKNVTVVDDSRPAKVKKKAKKKTKAKIKKVKRSNPKTGVPVESTRCPEALSPQPQKAILAYAPRCPEALRSTCRKV